LIAVADDRDAPALEQAQVSVLVVVDSHHSNPSRSSTTALSPVGPVTPRRRAGV
jgi:hypothetical protein